MQKPTSMSDVIVAGGSGGLGAPAAEMLRERWRVIVSWMNHEPLTGPAIQADITRAADRGRLLDAATDLYGLVIFTGIALRNLDEEEAMRRSHEVNYLGPVLLAREAAERMRASNTRGSIVLISTMQAVHLFPGSTPYAAQKAALIHAAQILAKEYRGPAEVRVNVICPGVMDAGMAKSSIANGKYTRYYQDGSIPRWGRAEDVARAVRFFLEPDSYITGQVLTIDGGLTL